MMTAAVAIVIDTMTVDTADAMITLRVSTAMLHVMIVTATVAVTVAAAAAAAEATIVHRVERRRTETLLPVPVTALAATTIVDVTIRSARGMVSATLC